jgi:hypothetical protein
MTISRTSSGSFKNTLRFLNHLNNLKINKIVEGQAKKGVAALSAATPVDSGRAALSWDYEIQKTAGSVTIHWTNDDIENGFSVAVMIQYGHGTGTGGWVQGIDYINPAMRPIFDQIAETVWKAVTSA